MRSHCPWVIRLRLVPLGDIAGCESIGILVGPTLPSMMRRRKRENAEITLFISLEPPTKGMVGDAASEGFYESPNGKKFPRLQLLMIEGLLKKKQRAEHPDYLPDLNLKKAKAEGSGEQMTLL